MWGVWNGVASYRLEAQVDDKDEFRSTEESTALEACTAMSYLYGLLPVVIIDVVLPSRYIYICLYIMCIYCAQTISLFYEYIVCIFYIMPTPLEACTAMSYLYGFLSVVIIDLVSRLGIYSNKYIYTTINIYIIYVYIYILYTYIHHIFAANPKP